MHLETDAIIHTRRVIESEGDVYELMTLADKNKTVKGTDMNARSSRSHTVFQVSLEPIRDRKDSCRKKNNLPEFHALASRFVLNKLAFE